MLSATIVFSLPLIAIGVLMCMSLMKILREDERRAGGIPAWETGLAQRICRGNRVGGYLSIDRRLRLCPDNDIG
ncbi:MAG: hypothetical protein WAW79_11090 [Steroidobacteraceae bacterium]